MASIKEAFNTAASLTITLNSLASGSGRQSTIIDNSGGLYLDAAVMVKTKTSSGVAATGTVTVYALGTVDGGNTYTDNAGASDAALTVINARPIGVFAATSSGQTYYGGPYSVAAAFGGILPSRWGIAVVNNTGAALDASSSNHSALYQELYATVA